MILSSALPPTWCLSTLFEITVKYSDKFQTEVEALWSALASATSHNVRTILKFLMQQSIEQRNPSFVMFARQIVVYLNRSPEGPNLYEVLVGRNGTRAWKWRDTPTSLVPDFVGFPHAAVFSGAFTGSIEARGVHNRSTRSDISSWICSPNLHPGSQLIYPFYSKLYSSRSTVISVSYMKRRKIFYSTFPSISSVSKISIPPSKQNYAYLSTISAVETTKVSGPTTAIAGTKGLYRAPRDRWSD